MTDPFILTVNYKGSELDYSAQLLLQGYTHKFKVLINDTEVFFEPDEEGQYRVVQAPGQEAAALAALDQGLLALLQQKIAEILL